MTRHPVEFILILLIALAFPVGANDDSSAEVKQSIAERFPGVTPDSVRPSPVPGLYEVAAGPIVFYVSADGRYMVRGEIYDLEGDRNLTEARVAEARARALAALDDKEVIVFGRADAKHTVTVFTDVDCSYCRVLHSKIDEYNKRGIRIRYAAYPRNGLASESWRTMEQAWCATDRQRALTLAKLDREFEHRQCNASEEVMEQWRLGQMLGVRGTPAIFTEGGQMIPGYLPPAELAKRLDALKAGG